MVSLKSRVPKNLNIYKLTILKTLLISTFFDNFRKKFYYNLQDNKNSSFNVF